MNREISEQIQEYIEELKRDPVIIIVEGNKDKKALERLGIDKDFILTLKKPFYKIVEEIQEFGECAILTDLDKKGKLYYEKFNSILPQRGVKINNRLRHFLFKKTKLRQIEGLHTFVKNYDLEMPIFI